MKPQLRPSSAASAQYSAVPLRASSCERNAKNKGSSGTEMVLVNAGGTKADVTARAICSTSLPTLGSEGHKCCLTSSRSKSCPACALYLKPFLSFLWLLIVQVHIFSENLSSAKDTHQSRLVLPL